MPRTLPALLLTLAVCGCVKPDIEESRSEMRQYLAGCTASFGFDPASAGQLDERRLAPGEREWRGCAYSGIERIVMPKSRAPDGWKRLIAEDRALTDQVNAGSLTRTERKRRLEIALDSVIDEERSLQAEEDAARLRKSSQMADQFDPLSLNSTRRVMDANIAAARGAIR